MNAQAISTLKSEPRKALLPWVICFFLIAIWGSVLVIWKIDTSEAILAMFGFVGTIFAIRIILQNTGTPLASFGLIHVILFAVVHMGGWVLARVFEEQHYTPLLDVTYTTFAYGAASAGLGLLFFALGYAYVSYSNQSGASFQTVKPDNSSGLDLINWNILLLWVFTIFAFEAAGGLAKYWGLEGAANYFYRSFFAYMAPLTIILFSLKTLIQFESKKLSILIIASIMAFYFFMIGDRQDVPPIILTIVILSAKWNIGRSNGRYFLAIVIIIISSLAAISYLRASVGRGYTKGTLGERIAFIFSPDQTTSQNNTVDAFRYDLGYRLNASNVLVGQLAEQKETDLWFGPYVLAISKLVPGIIWPNKPELFPFELPRVIANHYELTPVDYISTEISTFYSTGGYPLLAGSMFLFGVIIHILDRRATKCSTLTCCILSIGMGSSILQMDHSIDGWFITFRDAVFLILILKAIPRMTNNHPRHME